MKSFGQLSYHPGSSRITPMNTHHVPKSPKRNLRSTYNGVPLNYSAICFSQRKLTICMNSQQNIEWGHEVKWPHRWQVWPLLEVKVKFPVLNQLYRSNYIPNIFPKSHPSDEPLNTEETKGILCFLNRQKDSQQNVETFYVRSTDLKGASICPQFEVKVKFPVLNQLYRSNYMPNIFPKKPSRKVCYWKKWLSEEILVSKDSTRWALSFEPITKPYIRQINEIINGSSLGWL